MPELPEVETVRRGLAPWIEGARIERLDLYRPDLRFPFPQGFRQSLQGRTILKAGRRAKYLTFAVSGGGTWLAHLGMTGNFLVADHALPAPSRYRPGAPAGRHTHLCAALSHPAHGELLLLYSDPRRFGFMDYVAPGAPNPHLDPLGPEPLEAAFDGARLAERLKGKRAPIKAALLDQRVVAGLGNIYVCEALHRAGLSPERPAAALRGEECAALAAAIRAVLEEALLAGGSTLDTFRDAAGAPGYFQHSFSVYDRAGSPCPTPGCSGTVIRLVQAGRSSFFCPSCQR